MKRESIPNILSVFRILLIAPALYLLFQHRYLEATLVIGVAVFTDGLDGFLARHYGWRTRIGGLLDPVADKLLFVSVFIALAYLEHVALWLAGLVIGRDVLIAGGALVYERLIGPVKASPTLLSKINTLVLFLFVAAVLLRLAGLSLATEGVVNVLHMVVLITVIGSGAQYVWVWGQRAAQAAKTDEA